VEVLVLVVLALAFSSKRAAPSSEPFVPSSSPSHPVRPLSFNLAHRLRFDAAAAIERAVAESEAPRITSSFRTFEQQKALYELYRAGKGNLAAPPGQSLHETGLAIDARGTPEWELAMVRQGFKRTVKSEPWHWEYRP